MSCASCIPSFSTCVGHACSFFIRDAYKGRPAGDLYLGPAHACNIVCCVPQATDAASDLDSADLEEDEDGEAESDEEDMEPLEENPLGERPEVAPSMQAEQEGPDQKVRCAFGSWSA